MKNKLTNKKLKLLIIIVATLIIFQFFSSPVYGLGMAPSRKVYEYTEETITGSARILNNEKGEYTYVLYAEGEYADYVKISQSQLLIKSTESEKEFTYTIDLPKGLSPGTNKLSIVALAVPKNAELQQQNTNIVSTLSVAHQIWIEVPYPGIFAEGFVYISEGNVGDTLTFTTNILNKGTNTIKDIEGELIIKGPTNEEIFRTKTTILNNLIIQTSDKIFGTWKADANPGLYIAEVVVNYDGKQMVLRKEFTIGNFQLEITDIRVENYKTGAIAKFDVDIINKWNQPVKDVFANVQLIDTKGSILTSARTLPSDIQPLTTATLTAYWDTKGTEPGIYDIKVILNHGEKVFEKIFRAVIGIDSIEIQNAAHTGRVTGVDEKGNNLTLLYILVIISIISNILLFKYFKTKRKKE